MKKMEIDKEDLMEMNKQLGRIADALETLANCVNSADRFKTQTNM